MNNCVKVRIFTFSSKTKLETAPSHICYGGLFSIAGVGAKTGQMNDVSHPTIPTVLFRYCPDCRMVNFVFVSLIRYVIKIVNLLGI